MTSVVTERTGALAGEPPLDRPADLHAQFRSGEVLGNRYRIEALLGCGGMGAAYAATNLVTGKQVAVKWLLREPSANTLHRTLREARAACRVRHSNVVDVYDVAEHEGSLFLVMELLRGESLQARMRARGPLPLDELLTLLLPALRGLSELHRSGVIHRDLKPANIFLCQNTPSDPIVAKLLDFGVSKIVSATGEIEMESSITDKAALVGTPSYMAPEQLQEASSVDARADVYAFGAVLYHALSGRKPFDSESYPGLVAKVLGATPEPLSTLCPDLPKAVCSLIHRALERQPERRLPSIDALIQGLETRTDYDASDGASARAAAGRSSGALRWAVPALLVGAVALAWALARKPSESSAQPVERPRTGAIARAADVASAKGPNRDSTASTAPPVLERAQEAAPAAWNMLPLVESERSAPPKPRSARLAMRGQKAAPVSEPRRTPDGDPVIELTEEEF